MTNDTIGLIFGIVVIILVFLAIREVLAWYWKINDICQLLTKIEGNTRKDSHIEVKTKEENNPKSIA